jgi:hypothetical protein
MRYLVNLPLLGALILGWVIIHMAILSPGPRHGEAGMGAAILLGLVSIFLLILLTLTVLGSALTGGFDWMPIASRGGRIALTLSAFAALVLLYLLPLGIAVDSADGVDDSGWGPATIWASRAVIFGLPLLLVAYMTWLINAPDSVRQLPLIRYAALGGMAVLAVAAAIVSVQQLARWNRESAAKMDSERAEELAKADAGRREFAALTDADPLLKWYEFTTYGMPEDIREEAMRRIAARPDLDAELISALESDNPNWANEGVHLVAELAITPSPALAEAVRRRLDAYAKALVDDSKVVTYDGDKRLDYFEPIRLRDTLKAARKLAETNRADLRPQLEAVRQAVALYPKSDTAVRYPPEVDETQKQIAALLGVAQ